MSVFASTISLPAPAAAATPAAGATPAAAAAPAAAAPAARPSLFNPGGGGPAATITIPQPGARPGAAAAAIDPNAHPALRFVPAVAGAPDAAAVAAAAAAGAWTPETFLASLYTEAKLAVLPEAERGNISNVRPLLSAAMSKAAAFEKELAALKAGGGAADPKVMEKLKVLEARAELMDNSAFIEKHAGAVESFKATAKGLGVKEDLITQGMTVQTLAELLGVAKGITDPDIKAEFITAGKMALKATQEFHTAMKSPLESLEAARTMLAQKGVQRSQQTSEQIVALHAAAAQKLVADPESGWYFSTPHAQAKLAQIQERYTTGQPLPVSDIVSLQIKGESFDEMVRIVKSMGAELQTLRTNNGILTGHQPGASPGAAGAAAAGANPGGLFNVGNTTAGPVFKVVQPAAAK